MLSFIWSLLLSIACCLVNLLPTEISKFDLCTVHFMYISGNIEQILANERGNINIGSLYGKMSWKEECFPLTSSLNSAQVCCRYGVGEEERKMVRYFCSNYLH